MRVRSDIEPAEAVQVARSAGVIGAATLFSRVLGFIRDMVVAAAFGASQAADAFYVAFRIPSMLRELFAEGSMSAGFVPVFTEYLTRRSRPAAKRLADAAFTLLLAGLSGVSLAGILLAPWLVHVVAPGFGDEPSKWSLTVSLTRWMFPYLLFVGLAALTMGILNAARVFAPPAVSPALFNVCVIALAWSATAWFAEPITAIAVGVLIGGAAQWLVQLPWLYREGFPFRLRWEPDHEGIRRMGRLLLPVLLGLSVAQLNIFFNTVFASFLSEGSVTHLYYAMRLVHFPLGIFGIALATAILPSMATQAARGSTAELRDSLSFGLRLVVFLTLPALTGLIALRVPIVHVLFEHGEFAARDTVGTAMAVVGYAVGLWAFAGVRIVASAFYALQDTRTPVRIAAFSVVANIVLSLILMQYLAHVGLALATAIASMVNLAGLLGAIRGRVGFSASRVLPAVFRALLGCAALAGLCLWVADLPLWMAEGRWLEKSLALLLGISGGFVVYLGVHWLLKSEELMFLWQTVRQKMGR